MRLGVKPFDTRVRSRRCAGSSMARNDMVLAACGPLDAGSSEPPYLLDSVVLLRKPWCTSACGASTHAPASLLLWSAPPLPPRFFFCFTTTDPRGSLSHKGPEKAGVAC